MKKGGFMGKMGINKKTEEDWRAQWKENTDLEMEF